MSDYDQMSGQAIQIARETLRQLAARRIVPTPENYRSLYLEIAKTDAPGDGQHHVRLLRIVEQLRTSSAPHAADALAVAIEDKSWDASAQALSALAEQALKRRESAVAEPEATSAPLRDLLASLLESAVTQIGTSREIADEARVLAGRVRSLNNPSASVDSGALVESLRQFMRRLESQSEISAEMHAGLLKLLRLLIENVADLVDEQWVEGQLDAIRDMLAAPQNVQALHEAELAVREMLTRQGTLRSSLQEAKSTLKNMVGTLIERLGTLSDDTGGYQARIEGYGRRMQEINDVEGLNVLLDELLVDTRHMQNVTAESRADLISARARAEAAERRVRELEGELASVSAKVREDRLTGTLNRHGFDEAFARETSRAMRHETALAVALLDVDNFKQLNDTLGHGVGDSALQHLVRVIRDTLRPSDVVCRLGGEEFLLLLPETAVAEATQIMVRLQRELTRRIFLHKNEHILITFSAGVTAWQTEEAQESVIERADRALYEAKKLGKNRVCIAH